MSSEGEHEPARTHARPRRAADPTPRERQVSLLRRRSAATARRARTDPKAPAQLPRVIRALLPVVVAVVMMASITLGLSSGAPAADGAPSVAAPTQRGDRPNRDAPRPTLPPAGPSAATPSSAPPSAPTQPIHRVAATGTRWTTATLDLREQPSKHAEVDGTVASGTKVSITRQSGAYTGVLRGGVEYWVTAKYLTKTKPAGAGPVSSAPCASGSAVENGLTADAVRVHRAVCHAFPSITRFGGVRADSLPDHPSGRAVDNMLPHGASDNSLGWTVARWLRAHAAELGISYIQFDQHIWSVQRSAEGWRLQSDRGGVTANHRDHVHVTVYGNRGTV